MTHAQWKTLTRKKGLFDSRSSELKQLDTALLAYEQGTGTAKQLRDAFDKWDAKKTNVLNTVRNKRLDDQGLGPVARLSRFIHNAEGTALALSHAAEFDAGSNTRLTGWADYTKVHRKIVYEAVGQVREAIKAAIESFQKGGYYRNDFDGLYQMWFGARDAGRERQVKDKYDRLKAIVVDQTVNVHDDYAEPDFGHAYRGHNDVANIWIEEAFWDATDDYKKRFTSMLDARAGTMLHEFAHAIVDAADERLTDNKVCNDSARDRQLALNFPDKAINNADNLALYALDCLLLRSGKRIA
jgi:hypothetical protein